MRLMERSGQVQSNSNHRHVTSVSARNPGPLGGSSSLVTCFHNING